MPVIDDLLISSETTRKVIDSIDIGIIILDQEHRIVLWNRWIATITGIKCENSIGKKFETIHNGPINARLSNSIEQALKDGFSSILSNKFCSIYIPVESQSCIAQKLYIRPIRSAKRQYCLIEVIDVSAEVRREKSLLKISEKESAARKEAERLSQIKSEFLSNMSHELRTPMNAILGFSKLLLLEDIILNNRELSENVNQIQNSGQHLLSLLNDILDMSIVESGHLTLCKGPTDLSEVVQEAAAIIKPQMQLTNIKLRCQLPTSSFIVNVDRGKIKQVVLNLLTNAIKYNKPNGSVSICIEQTTEHVVRVSVTDSGIGIDENNKKEIFKPFSRLHANLYDIEGAGIGLSLAKSYIEAMSGKIGFESQLDVGSTFWFEVPIFTDETIINQRK